MSKITKKSIKAAKKLVEIYRSVTLDQIKSKWIKDNYLQRNVNFTIINSLTGAGNIETCVLCNAAGNDKEKKTNCSKCIHSHEFKIDKYLPKYHKLVTGKDASYCSRGVSEITFDAMFEAKRPRQMLRRIRRRANYIENRIKSFEKS